MRSAIHEKQTVTQVKAQPVCAANRRHAALADTFVIAKRIRT
jgi:hypothetical protein